MNIRVIQTGEVQIKSRHVRARHEARPARVLDVLTDRKWSPRLPIQCFVIEHPEGVIVVDTGESSRANDPGYQPWWHPFTRTSERRWVAPEEEVGPQLQRFGIDPNSVRWVVMTHMHGDHSGGLRHFPNSEIVMSAPEAAMALARTGPLNGYLNSHYPDWLDPRRVTFDANPWEGFAASVPLTPDGAVRLIPAPGHTLGNLCVVVEQPEHLVLLAGDTAYSERSLIEGVVDGVAQDAAAHRRTTALLQALCSRRSVVTLFAHDANAPQRLAHNVPTTGLTFDAIQLPAGQAMNVCGGAVPY